jgi:drug/metabolite transporter (DMT)-like permease
MIYLVLSILFTVCLFVVFKLYALYNVNTFQAIVINYWVCVVTGMWFMSNPVQLWEVHISMPWVRVALFLGLLFIFTFNLMAITTQRLGVTIATVAGKMSLIIPVLASLLVFKSSAKSFDIAGYIGLLFALVAILLTSVKKKEKPATDEAIPLKLTPVMILLPLGVFLFSGLIDTSINYVNFSLLQPDQSEVFPIVIFAMAAFAGTMTMAIRGIVYKEKFQWRSIPAGVILGVPNYFSIYFLVMALTAFNNDGAFLYPVINIGVIITSAIVAVFLFKERLTVINKVGVGLAILAIILLSYKEILQQINT